MKNKKIALMELSLVIGILVIMLCSLVSAFGAYVPYDTGAATLIMAPGETKDFKITLSTSPTESNMAIKADILKGGEIATLTDSNLIYQLAGNGGTASANARVTIPQDAVEGTEYNVNFKFSQTAPSAGGTISFISSIEHSMKVLVQKPVTPTPTPTETPAEEEIGVGWIILGIIIIIAVIIIIYYIIKSRKK